MSHELHESKQVFEDSLYFFTATIERHGRNLWPHIVFLYSFVTTKLIITRPYYYLDTMEEQLKAKHLRAYPKNESQEMEDYPLDGGHTIKTYGTNGNKSGLVAIQIEVINCIRDNRYCREKFAADMADCIYKFVLPFI